MELDIDMSRIRELFDRITNLNRRASTVIANAQKSTSLNDAQKLFCAFLAHQTQVTLTGCATKLGLKLDEKYPDGIETAVETFFGPATAQFLGTDPILIESGYTNAVEFLVNSAEDVVVRAERVLTGQGSISSK